MSTLDGSLQNIQNQSRQPILPLSQPNRYESPIIEDTSNDENQESVNLFNLKYILSRSENPNPITIVIIICIIMVMLYFIYINYIKLSISGLWLDDNNNQHTILHNKYTDELSINNNYGLIKGNSVYYYIDNNMYIGVLVKNEIMWCSGSSWHYIMDV